MSQGSCPERRLVPFGILLALFLLIGLPACSGVFPSPAPATPSLAAAQSGGHAPSGALRIAEITWYRGNLQMIKLYANGLVEERGAPLGVLKDNGTFVNVDGTKLFSMDATGHIALGDGVEVTIDEQGNAVMRVPGEDDHAMSIEGVTKLSPDRQAMRVEGPPGESTAARSALAPGLRRTAMLVLLAPDLVRILQPERVQ